MSIRVLVADDSPTARAFMVNVLHEDPELLVIGQATNGAEAIEMTKRLRPDVVLSDLRMPQLDGLEAARRIMQEVPTPLVIVSSSLEHGAQAGLEALAAGALAVIPKPPSPQDASFDEALFTFIQTIKAMARVKVVRRRGQPRPAPEPPRQVDEQVWRRPASVVAMAASTGGPNALLTVLSRLPPTYALPILLVQHITPDFQEGFVDWLDHTVPLRVKLAQHQEVPRPGVVYVAPSGHHMVTGNDGRLLMSGAPPFGGFRPSASHLFETVAHSFGDRALAVILTGMGDDGLTGLRCIREQGGRVIAQDEQSSAVFGMPGAAVNAGLADATLPPDQIAARLIQVTEGVRT
jgi:two-component system, chemotaxis family, protein-glutamate methylesterase/glutaminase